MRIEEEIKQHQFKSEYQKLVINQLFTGKWVADIISTQLKPFGITSQQYNVLRILRGQHPNAVAVNMITGRMIDKMSNVSRLVDKLNQKGLVVRKVNYADRRQMDISITEKGLTLLEELDPIQDKIQSAFKNLTEKEAQQLNNLLDKLRG